VRAYISGPHCTCRWWPCRWWQLLHQSNCHLLHVEMTKIALINSKTLKKTDKFQLI